MTLQRLNEHLNMILELQGAEERLSYMRSQILSAVNYDGMPHGHEVSRNTENLAILLQNQIDDVNRLSRMVESSEREIREFVESIEDNRTKVIFNLRFLCGFKWEAVGRMLGKGISADAVRSVCMRYLSKERENDGLHSITNLNDGLHPQ